MQSTPAARPRQPLAPIRPHPTEPGTLREQLDAIALYLADPTRRHDPAGAWQMARRLVLDHARRRDT